MSDNVPVVTPEAQLGFFNLHLINGQEIIGKVWAIQDNDQSVSYYVVENPLIPRISIDGTKMNIGFLPFRPYVKADKLVVDPNHVVFLLPITQQMEETYRTYISGIVVAPANAVPNLVTEA